MSNQEESPTSARSLLVPPLFARSLNEMLELDSSPTSSTSLMSENFISKRRDASLESFWEQSECVVFVQKDFPAHTWPMFDQMRKEDKLCDVVLKVGENFYPAHRVILAATIPYFSAMFGHNMIECEKKEIDLKMDTVDSGSIESILNFVYSGRLTISTSNVQNLMTAASFFQISKIRDACADFLMNRISPSNVIGIRAFAEVVGCFSLSAACEKFILKFFSHVSKSDEFSNLSFEEVHDFVNRDELYVSSEEEVFSAVLEWVKRDVEMRQNFLPKLLSCVRLPLMKPQFLTDKVATEDLIRSSHQCRDLLDEARDYHLLPERRQLLQSFKTKPRRSKDLVGVIYIVGGLTKSGNSLSTVEVLDPVIGRWRDAEAMTMNRSRVGVAVMNDNLFAIGGYNGVDRLNTVEVFDVHLKRWSRVASMHCRRSAVGAVTVNDKIFVCGGFDGVTSLDSVEFYDSESDKWTMMPSMIKHRSASGIVQLYGKIYAIGGHNGLSIFDSVECYDFITDRWTEISPMLTKRCRLGAASLGGKIYVCGGYDGSSFLKSVEVFDPVANKWQFVSPMNVTRSRVAVVANMDRLWAIGGYDGMKNLSSVETYNPETDEWTFVAPMASHEGGVGAGVIPLDH